MFELPEKNDRRWTIEIDVLGVINKVNGYQISVIVPVYNTEQYLPGCIESLLRQKMPVRIILVDDGSTDGSGAICDRYAEEYANITVIHQENGGSGSAKNAGLEQAETELIGFTDSDDRVTEDMYEYLYQLLTGHQADIAQIEYVTVSEGQDTGIVSRKERVLCFETRESILKRYLEDGMKPVKSYSTCTKLYRKSLFDNIRFPENRKYDDVTTNYEILSKARKYVISNRQCYYYITREKSITQGCFQKEDLDYIKVGEQIAERTKNEPELRKPGEMTLARFHFTCLCKMLKYGCDPSFDWKEQINISIPVIRSGMGELLKSGMRADRKILMILLCANKKLTTRLVRRRTDQKKIPKDRKETRKICS